MPEPEKIRISFDIEGDLARAFVEEMGDLVKTIGPTMARKSALGRAALVEYLNRRGHAVEDETASWGGSREASEDEQPGQLMGLEAA